MQLLRASVSSSAKETQWLPFLLQRTQRIKWRKRHSPHSLDDPLPSSPCRLEALLRTESTNTGFLSALPGPPQTLTSPFFTWPTPDFLEDTAPKSSYRTWRPGISNSVLSHKDFCSNKDFAKFHLMEQKSELWQVREMGSVSDSAGELLLYSKAQRSQRSGLRLHQGSQWQTEGWDLTLEV